MNAVTPRERVSQLVTELGVARNRDFKRAGIHTQYVGEACNAGLIERVGRGTYALSGHIKTPQQRIAEACKRVPQGVVCLFSALWFHGLVEKEPEAIWMAIDRKAREPRVDSVPIEFVLFSGNAMTQGVVNLRVGGVPVRVYSPMKTVADCFKYADKIGTDIGPKALAAAIRGNQYNRQKLLRFAEICRVKRAVAAAENARKQPEPDRPTKEAEMVSLPARVWDREVLQEQVWTQPIRQLAKKYGVSDVAIHKHCKKWVSNSPVAVTGRSRRTQGAARRSKAIMTEGSSPTSSRLIFRLMRNPAGREAPWAFIVTDQTRFSRSRVTTAGNFRLARQPPGTSS